MSYIVHKKTYLKKENEEAKLIKENTISFKRQKSAMNYFKGTLDLKGLIKVFNSSEKELEYSYHTLIDPRGRILGNTKANVEHIVNEVPQRYNFDYSLIENKMKDMTIDIWFTT